MINNDLKKLQNEVEKLQIKANALDKIENLINMCIRFKKNTIEVEAIRKIVYEALDKIKEPTLWCKV